MIADLQKSCRDAKAYPSFLRPNFLADIFSHIGYMHVGPLGSHVCSGNVSLVFSEPLRPSCRADIQPCLETQTGIHSHALPTGKSTSNPQTSCKCCHSPNNRPFVPMSPEPDLIEKHTTFSHWVVLRVFCVCCLGFWFVCFFGLYRLIALILSQLLLLYDEIQATQSRQE